MLVMAGILTFVFWKKDDGGPGSGVNLANGSPPGTETPAVVAPLSPPAREDFSNLPPRDRINAETKQRMEEAAAWREKLRNGDQTTLPPEAYPPGVPPHTPPSPQ